MYLFADESGDLSFNPKGSQYLILTCLSVENPYPLMNELHLLKNHLISEGKHIDYFHASEDRQAVRDEVYQILRDSQDFKVDCVVIEKAKTNPVFYETPERLYVRIYECLLRYVLDKQVFPELFIFTHNYPHKKKRQMVEKGIKEGLRRILVKQEKFWLQQLPSTLSFGLQAVDYCSWAIYRKWGDWSDKEPRPYNMISDKMHSEFNYFESGEAIYYGRNDPPD